MPEKIAIKVTDEVLYKGLVRWRNCLNLVGKPFMINPGGGET